MINAPIYSAWFNRFQVFDADAQHLFFRDWLNPRTRLLDRTLFSQLDGLALQQAYMQKGFMSASLSAFEHPIHDLPSDKNDFLFWQYPCRTEGSAWQRHAELAEPVLVDGNMHIYLGLPWATWIDCSRKKTWGEFGEGIVLRQLQTLRLQMHGWQMVLQELGLKLRVHTVCQHIYWRDMCQIWRDVGVTDVWVSHCPNGKLLPASDSLQIHPWALYAVNLQDNARRVGMIVGKDPANKSILASFVGAYTTGYLSDARLRLLNFAHEPDFVVRVNGKWHFEDIVYKQQIAREDITTTATLDDSVESYNRVLSDSIFSLCPSGTGPNTLRLWESLAVGAIPVLFGPEARMPIGGNLAPIDWDSILLRIPEQQFDDLPRILRNMKMTEIRQRQQAGMQAFAQVAQQRCF